MNKNKQLRMNSIYYCINMVMSTVNDFTRICEFLQLYFYFYKQITLTDKIKHHMMVIYKL